MNDNTNIATGTIFDEIGRDERQKTENHEIGYKLFSIMFFITLLFSMVLVIICRNMNDLPGMVISLVLMATVYGFYIAYAYLTAKKGIMNPKFAKGWSGKWVIPVYIVIALIWGSKILRLDGEKPSLDDVTLALMWLIIITGCIAISLCARKNNRVLKEQLDDTNDDDD